MILPILYGWTEVFVATYPAVKFGAAFGKHVRSNDRERNLRNDREKYAHDGRRQEESATDHEGALFAVGIFPLANK